ncbi:MAG: amidohydrolase family protein [Gemmatimonadota bacterium]
MRIDVSAFLGAYPWRRLPGTSPDALLAAMARTGIDSAWVSHLPSFFWRDPMEGNAWLYDVTVANKALAPVPTIHPGLPGWEAELQLAVQRDAPAVRADPTWFGLDVRGGAMISLARACGAVGMPLMLAVRLEDGRQRHPNDRTEELPPWAVRSLVRSDPSVRLVVTHAERTFIEEVHFGATPEEAARIWWDITWVWGPPEDHLETLLGTIGPARFLFGTGQPLRIPENSIAKLDLIDLPADGRASIESGNASLLRYPPST